MKQDKPGDETFQEAMCELMAEPDPNVRWSMIVHRGASAALIGMCEKSNAAPLRWDKENPDFEWTIALMQDPEYIAASRELFLESERQARDAETGLDKNRRRDRHARKHWALYYATRDRRSAEGWTPSPIPARTVNPVAHAILGGLMGLARGNLAKFAGDGV